MYVLVCNLKEEIWKRNRLTPYYVLLCPCACPDYGILSCILLKSISLCWLLNIYCFFVSLYSCLKELTHIPPNSYKNVQLQWDFLDLRNINYNKLQIISQRDVKQQIYRVHKNSLTLVYIIPQVSFYFFLHTKIEHIYVNIL